MTKQKVVLKLSMENDKKRSKAMQCVTGLRGVVSATVDGDKLTVEGEIDSVELTRLLRKKMGGYLTTLLRKKMGVYVELVAVTVIEEKKKEEKAEDKVIVQPWIPPYYYGPRPYYYEDMANYGQNNCSIM